MHQGIMKKGKDSQQNERQNLRIMFLMYNIA